MSLIRKGIINAVEKAIKGDRLDKAAPSPGSRLERLGTIYSRVTGLIKSQVLPKSDIPLWYHVYQAFPPKYEPQYSRPPLMNVKIQKIFYPEDKLRAQISEREDINFFTNERTNSQKIVEEFQRLKESNSSQSDEAIISLVLQKKSSGYEP